MPDRPSMDQLMRGRKSDANRVFGHSRPTQAEVITAAVDAKERERDALINGGTTIADETTADDRAQQTTSFDGGARTTSRQPQNFDALLRGGS